MARKAKPIILKGQELQELTSMSRSNKLDYRYVIRSRIILGLYQGKSYDQVQKELSIGREAVAKWKGRFLDIGIQGLMDKPGRGAKPKYSDEDRARIVQKACEKPEGGYTSWSQRRIAKELGMSQSTVQKTLKEHILKPHKVDYWCGKSTDPEFETLKERYFKTP
jgi:transposase